MRMSVVDYGNRMALPDRRQERGVYGRARDRLTVRRREGTESFHDKNHELGFVLLDFWQWSSCFRPWCAG